MLAYLRYSKNEDLNSAVAQLAPKSRTYCRTKSLWARVSIVTGQINIGNTQFWTELLTTYFGIDINPSLMTALELFDKEVSYRRVYKKNES